MCFGCIFIPNHVIFSQNLKKLANMPTRCIVAGCSNTTKEGVSLHNFPNDEKSGKRRADQALRGKPLVNDRNARYLCQRFPGAVIESTAGCARLTSLCLAFPFHFYTSALAAYLHFLSYLSLVFERRVCSSISAFPHVLTQSFSPRGCS